MSQTLPPAVPEKFLRLREVCELIGWKRSMIYKAIARGHFPRQIKLSSRSMCFRAGEIAAWQAAKIAERAAATAH